MAPNDTTTTLSLGTEDGAVMDESLVVQGDGVTEAKRVRAVIGDDNGDLYGNERPMPVDSAYARRAAERQQLMSLTKLDVNLTTRHRERMRHGDRLDLIDFRGPGGR